MPELSQLTTSVELDAEDLYALTDGIAFGLQYLRGIYGEGRIEALHRRLTEARRIAPLARWRGYWSAYGAGAKRNMTNYISSFLQAHGDIIESTSLMSDQLTITFKPTVSVRRMVIVMADLINYVQPIKAHARLENRMIRLEF